MPTPLPARRRRWQGAEQSARSWPRSQAIRRRGSPGRTGAERPVVLLPDDTPAVHAVWWASRSGAGSMEVREDPQQGTCGAGTTGHRASCGRMTRASARQAVRVLSMLPQACRTGTTGLTGAVARCGAGTVRGTSTVALRGCRGLRLHRCPRSAVLCSGHGTSRAARRQEEHACGCTTSEQPRPWHPTRAACARQTVGLPRGLADVTHRVLRVSCAARTGANVAA